MGLRTGPIQEGSQPGLGWIAKLAREKTPRPSGDLRGTKPERLQLFNRVVLHSSWEGRLVARGISLFVISYLVAHLLRRHALHDGQLNAGRKLLVQASLLALVGMRAMRLHLRSVEGHAVMEPCILCPRSDKRFDSCLRCAGSPTAFLACRAGRVAHPRGHRR